MCFIKFWTTFIFSRKIFSKNFQSQKSDIFLKKNFFLKIFIQLCVSSNSEQLSFFQQKKNSKISRKVSKIFFRSCRTNFSAKNEMFVYTLWISSPILRLSDLLGGKVLAIYWLLNFQNWAWPIWAWSMSRILADQFLCFY